MSPNWKKDIQKTLVNELKAQIIETINGLDVDINHTLLIRQTINEQFDYLLNLLNPSDGPDLDPISGGAVHTKPKKDIEPEEESESADECSDVKNTPNNITAFPVMSEEQAETNTSWQAINCDDDAETINVQPNMLDETKEAGPFLMKRILSGGMLQNAEFPYVPEKNVRLQGFEDGDYITTKLESYTGTTVRKPIFSFNLFCKGTPNDQSRIERKFLRVDKHGPNLCIQEDIYGEPLISTNNQITFDIPEDQISRYNLNKGDIVDVAWYKGVNSTMAVIWKYPTEQQEELTVEAKMRLAKKSEQKEKPTATKPPQVLQDMVVTIIGAYEWHDQCKEVIEGHGGTIHAIADNAHINTLSAAVKKSDLVVINTNYVNHDQMYSAKGRAKKYNIPFTVMDSFGKEKLLRLILDHKKSQA